jgi:hypothetical protein
VQAMIVVLMMATALVFVSTVCADTNLTMVVLPDMKNTTMPIRQLVIVASMDFHRAWVVVSLVFASIHQVIVR